MAVSSGPSSQGVVSSTETRSALPDPRFTIAVPPAGTSIGCKADWKFRVRDTAGFGSIGVGLNSPLAKYLTTHGPGSSGYESSEKVWIGGSTTSGKPAGLAGLQNGVKGGPTKLPSRR